MDYFPNKSYQYSTQISLSRWRYFLVCGFIYIKLYLHILYCRDGKIPPGTVDLIRRKILWRVDGMKLLFRLNSYLLLENHQWSWWIRGGSHSGLFYNELWNTSKHFLLSRSVIRPLSRLIMRTKQQPGWFAEGSGCSPCGNKLLRTGKHACIHQGFHCNVFFPGWCEMKCKISL